LYSTTADDIVDYHKRPKGRQMMFEKLEAINTRPLPFEFYTASDLWTDPHISKQMLSYHLNQDVDLASRKSVFIDRSVEWIAGRFGITAQTKVADFGCGPGLYATGLARRQAQVTGIDFSAHSIQYAKEVASKEGLCVNYVNQDYLTFETETRFHLVLMIMCDFCALSPDQRRTMLRTFHGLLEPGGSVLLDVYSPAGFARREEAATYEENMLDGFWSPDRYFGFLNTFKYEQEQVVVDKYTIIESSRMRTVYNWLQYFSPEALEREFTECGFVVDARYADVAGAPFDPSATEFAIVAQKS
jgi:SAM-dependent methyltransferase